MLALDEELVEPADEAIDDVSKAAGVNRSGRVRGEEDVDEADEVSVEESDADVLDEHEDNVEAAEDVDEPDDEYLEEKFFFTFFLSVFFSGFLFRKDN